SRRRRFEVVWQNSGFRTNHPSQKTARRLLRHQKRPVQLSWPGSDAGRLPVLIPGASPCWNLRRWLRQTESRQTFLCHNASTIKTTGMLPTSSTKESRSAGGLEFCSGEFRKDITPLLHYSIIPALAVQERQ